MSDQNKIYNLYESLNQSAIAVDQQRKDSYKYAPKQGKQSYLKYGIPTTTAAKVNGSPFIPDGLSDEEVLIKGFGKMEKNQVDRMLQNVKIDIIDLIDKNVAGQILNSKIDLYKSLIEIMDN